MQGGHYYQTDYFSYGACSGKCQIIGVAYRTRFLVQVTIYRMDRDGHLDQSEAYDIS